MVAKGQFPTRDNCDPGNPEEAFLWMFAALPGTRGGPLLLPVEYMRLVSKRLWDLGARPTEAPTLQWVPPSATEPNWSTSPGRWVEPGSVDEAQAEQAQAKSSLTRMTAQQRHELKQALEATEQLPTKAGEVARALSERQRAMILSMLQEWGG